MKGSSLSRITTILAICGPLPSVLLVRVTHRDLQRKMLPALIAATMTFGAILIILLECLVEIKLSLTTHRTSLPANLLQIFDALSDMD
jgi:hypothetical protein